MGAFGTFFAAVLVTKEVGFQGHRDGHFFARDGHYDSNDHREQKNDGFRVLGKRLFLPSPPPRRVYRQIIGGRKAPARYRKAENVYLYILRKIFTMSGGG